MRVPRVSSSLRMSIRNGLPVLLPRSPTVRPRRRRRTAGRQFYRDDGSTCGDGSSWPRHSCSTRSNVGGRSTRLFDRFIAHVNVRNRGLRRRRDVLFVVRLRNSIVRVQSICVCLDGAYSDGFSCFFFSPSCFG